MGDEEPLVKDLFLSECLGAKVYAIPFSRLHCVMVDVQYIKHAAWRLRQTADRPKRICGDFVCHWLAPTGEREDVVTVVDLPARSVIDHTGLN